MTTTRADRPRAAVLRTSAAVVLLAVVVSGCGKTVLNTARGEQKIAALV